MVSPQRKTKPANMWWPDVGTLDQAITASNGGFMVAMLVAAINAVVATISLVQHTAIAGIDANGYVDAGLFALAGWGIRCRSRVAAIAGLLFFLLEKVYQFTTQPKALMGLWLAIIILVGFVGGVRGTFAYHRLAPAGFAEEAKPIMVMGVDLRRPLAIWITALLCLVILYKLVMGWVGGTLVLFGLKTAVLVLAAMTFLAIFKRPAWGRTVASLFSLLVAALLVFVAAKSRPTSIAAEMMIWVILGGSAALYVYAMCVGKTIRAYFAKAKVVAIP